MSVYVDNFYTTGITFRGMKMCHMVADTTEELLTMVDAVGVKRKWIQSPGTANEHFDVCLSMRKKAIALGAIEIHFKEYARFVNKRAAAYGIPALESSAIKLPAQKPCIPPFPRLLKLR